MIDARSGVRWRTDLRDLVLAILAAGFLLIISGRLFGWSLSVTWLSLSGLVAGVATIGLFQWIAERDSTPQRERRELSADAYGLRVRIGEAVESYPWDQCRWWPGPASDDPTLRAFPHQEPVTLISVPNDRVFACGVSSNTRRDWTELLRREGVRRVSRPLGVRCWLVTVAIALAFAAGAELGLRAGDGLRLNFLPAGVGPVVLGSWLGWMAAAGAGNGLRLASRNPEPPSIMTRWKWRISAVGFPAAVATLLAMRYGVAVGGFYFVPTAVLFVAGQELLLRGPRQSAEEPRIDAVGADEQ